MPAAAPATQAGLLLTRARIYQVLANGYAYPSGGQRDGMGTLLGRPDAWAGAGDGWSPVLSDLCDQVAAAIQEEVEGDFNRLFSGPVDCSPHETAYEPDIFRRQRALADVSGFYQAFGFDLDEATRWQPDHIGVELEFCAILLQRHARAVEEGWDEQAEVCDRALRAFLKDHTGRWHQAFSHRLRRLATTAFYRSLAEATTAWVQAELDRLRLRPEPLADRPRTAPDDDALPSCGA